MAPIKGTGLGVVALAALALTGARSEAQEDASCASLVRRVREGTFGSSELTGVRVCPTTGPRALAEALHGSGAGSARRAEIVRATPLLEDTSLLDAGLRLARSGNAVDAIDGVRVVAGQVWESGYDISSRWLSTALPGQMPPRATHPSPRQRGASPVTREGRQKASSLFHEMSLSSDPEARRAGILLRAAAAQEWPEEVVLPPDISLIIRARCGDPSNLVIETDLDVPLEFEVVSDTIRRKVRLGGPGAGDVASGAWATRTGPVRTILGLQMPPGEVAVVRLGREFGRLSSLERSRQLDSCRK